MAQKGGIWDHMQPRDQGSGAEIPVVLMTDITII